MASAITYQTRTITIPRGNNIGYSIIANLEQDNIYGKVDIHTITPRRDRKAKTTIVTLQYSPKTH